MKFQVKRYYIGVNEFNSKIIIVVNINNSVFTGAYDILFIIKLMLFKLCKSDVFRT